MTLFKRAERSRSKVVVSAKTYRCTCGYEEIAASDRGTPVCPHCNTPMSGGQSEKSSASEQDLPKE